MTIDPFDHALDGESFPLEKIPGLKLWSETERIINLAVEMKAALAAVDD